MSNRSKARRRAKTDAKKQAMDDAAAQMMWVLENRLHPELYNASELRAFLVADVVVGAHGVSPPHLWFFVESVTRIGKLEKKGREAVTRELLAEAEQIRPGSTIT